MKGKRLAVLGVVVAMLGYYFGGTAGQPGTRSYFLEKRLNHLLFLETHEPVDYAQTLAEYELILPRIRFGADTNSPSRYRRAVARTKVTLAILSHLRHYATTGDVADLKQAHDLFRTVFAKELNEYGFYTVYLDHRPITEDWFRDQRIKAAIPFESLQ